MSWLQYQKQGKTKTICWMTFDSHCTIALATYSMILQIAKSVISCRMVLCTTTAQRLSVVFICWRPFPEGKTTSNLCFKTDLQSILDRCEIHSDNPHACSAEHARCFLTQKSVTFSAHVRKIMHEKSVRLSLWATRLIINDFLMELSIKQMTSISCSMFHTAMEPCLMYILTRPTSAVQQI